MARTNGIQYAMETSTIATAVAKKNRRSFSMFQPLEKALKVQLLQSAAGCE
jgi:hypothetical protein